MKTKALTDDELQRLARQVAERKDEEEKLREQQTEERRRQKEEADRKRERLERLPKVALVVPDDGTKPDGLNTRTAARIIYKDKELFLNKPERYVLSTFVYMTDTDETTKANNTAKSKMTDNEIRRFIDLRNSVCALFYLGQTLSHDAYELELLAELHSKTDAAVWTSNEEKAKQARSLQRLFDWTTLRVDAQLRAVERFCLEVGLPEHLRHATVADASDVLRRRCGRLFDMFDDTVQFDEVEKMTFAYLVERKRKLTTLF